MVPPQPPPSPPPLLAHNDYKDNLKALDAGWRRFLESGGDPELVAAVMRSALRENLGAVARIQDAVNKELVAMDSMRRHDPSRVDACLLDVTAGLTEDSKLARGLETNLVMAYSTSAAIEAKDLACDARSFALSQGADPGRVEAEAQQVQDGCQQAYATVRQLFGSYGTHITMGAALETGYIGHAVRRLLPRPLDTAGLVSCIEGISLRVSLGDYLSLHQGADVLEHKIYACAATGLALIPRIASLNERCSFCAAPTLPKATLSDLAVIRRRKLVEACCRLRQVSLIKQMLGKQLRASSQALLGMEAEVTPLLLCGYEPELASISFGAVFMHILSETRAKCEAAAQRSALEALGREAAAARSQAGTAEAKASWAGKQALHASQKAAEAKQQVAELAGAVQQTSSRLAAAEGAAASAADMLAAAQGDATEAKEQVAEVTAAVQQAGSEVAVARGLAVQANEGVAYISESLAHTNEGLSHTHSLAAQADGTANYVAGQLSQHMQACSITLDNMAGAVLGVQGGLAQTNEIVAEYKEQVVLLSATVATLIKLAKGKRRRRGSAADSDGEEEEEEEEEDAGGEERSAAKDRIKKRARRVEPRQLQNKFAAIRISKGSPSPARTQPCPAASDGASSSRLDDPVVPPPKPLGPHNSLGSLPTGPPLFSFPKLSAEPTPTPAGLFRGMANDP